MSELNEKKVKTRIVHKHDTPENWAKATGFIPKQGELIIYDNYDAASNKVAEAVRYKIGDGSRTVNDLPFANIAIQDNNGIVIDEGVALGNTSIAGGTTNTNVIKSVLGEGYQQLIEKYGSVANLPDSVISLVLNLTGADYTVDEFKRMLTVEPAKAEGILSIAYGTSITAQTAGSITMGYGNISGAKGYYISSITSNSVTLSTKQNSAQAPSSSVTWSAGDRVHIVNDERYLLTIKNVSGNVVTFEETVPFDSLVDLNKLSIPLVGTYDITNPNERSIVNIDNPLAGEVDLGWGALSLGAFNTATGSNSIAAGYMNNAYGDFGAAFGQENEVGYSAFATGILNMAKGKASYANGEGNTASGRASQSVGKDTTASGDYSQSSGYETTASGWASHTEGHTTQAKKSMSHAEGNHCIADGEDAHAEGFYTEARNDHAHAEGKNTIADGVASHAEGGDTQAIKSFSHAEGSETIASGWASHAEGHKTIAEGTDAHAEGYNTKALEERSHAEGYSTTASGKYAHAEGGPTTDGDNVTYNVIASGNGSHAEGLGTTASKTAAHAEGVITTAEGYAAHAEGGRSKATSEYAHAEGYNTTASGVKSHAEGTETTAEGAHGHAEGNNTKAIGWASHAEGHKTKASGTDAHAEGYLTVAGGERSHAEGDESEALGHAAHAEGEGTYAEGANSHVEGYYTKTIKESSHAEGYQTTAIGKYSSATGESSNRFTDVPRTDDPSKNLNGGSSIDIIYNTWNDSVKFLAAKGIAAHAGGKDCIALGDYSDATGYQTVAKGLASQAEGKLTQANGDHSHAEGSTTFADGMSSHAEGWNTHATKEGAHAEGWQTWAEGDASHAEGKETKAIGQASHAEGNNTTAVGYASHAGGSYTTAGYFELLSNNRLISVDTGLHPVFNGDVEIYIRGEVLANPDDKYLHLKVDSEYIPIWSLSEYNDVQDETYIRAYVSDDQLEKLLAAQFINIVKYCEAENSFAHGLYLQTTAKNQTAFGKYNATRDDALFIVGNGENHENRSNAFEVKANGEVVIGGVTLTSEKLAKIIKFIDSLEEVIE